MNRSRQLAMALALIGNDDREKRRYAVPNGEVIIGGRPGCGVVLDAPSIAPRHARVFSIEGSSTIYGLNADWPLYVNGAAVRRHELVPGDEIELAHYRLRFIDPTAPDQTQAAPTAAGPEPAVPAAANAGGRESMPVGDAGAGGVEPPKLPPEESRPAPLDAAPSRAAGNEAWDSPRPGPEPAPVAGDGDAVETFGDQRPHEIREEEATEPAPDSSQDTTKSVDAPGADCEGEMPRIANDPDLATRAESPARAEDSRAAPAGPASGTPAAASTWVWGAVSAGRPPADDADNAPAADDASKQAGMIETLDPGAPLAPPRAAPENTQDETRPALPAPTLHLDILSGINQGRRVSLTREVVVLGFDSERLVELRRGNGGLWVRRIGDNAEAQLNGEPIADESVTAHPGDVLSVQRIEMRIDEEP